MRHVSDIVCKRLLGKAFTTAHLIFTTARKLYNRLQTPHTVCRLCCYDAYAASVHFSIYYFLFFFELFLFCFTNFVSCILWVFSIGGLRLNAHRCGSCHPYALCCGLVLKFYYGCIRCICAARFQVTYRKCNFAHFVTKKLTSASRLGHL